jgi:hypothetical protein
MMMGWIGGNRGGSQDLHELLILRRRRESIGREYRVFAGAAQHGVWKKKATRNDGDRALADLLRSSKFTFQKFKFQQAFVAVINFALKVHQISLPDIIFNVDNYLSKALDRWSTSFSASLTRPRE